MWREGSHRSDFRDGDFVVTEAAEPIRLRVVPLAEDNLGTKRRDQVGVGDGGRSRRARHSDLRQFNSLVVVMTNRVWRADGASVSVGGVKLRVSLVGSHCTTEFWPVV